MGDSSVSCVLSGLTLHSEKAVFIPLRTADYPCKLQGARLFGFPNATALFEALTLPIYVTTDSCGYFESVEENANTRIVSEYFAKPIGEFLDACVEGDTISTPKLEEPSKYAGSSVTLAGCYVARDVYDRFSRPILGGRYAGSLWSDDLAGEPHLLAIGCVQQEVFEAPDRSIQIFSHPEIQGVLFAFDGFGAQAIRVEQLAEAKGQWLSRSRLRTSLYGYSLEKMHCALIGMGAKGFPLERIEIAKQSRALVARLRQDCDTLRSRLTTALEARNMLALSGASRDPYWERPLSRCSDLAYLRISESFGGLFDLYWREGWSEYDSKSLEGLADLLEFIRSMDRTNRILMPTPTGSQYPEHDEGFVVARFVADLALKKLRESKRSQGG